MAVTLEQCKQLTGRVIDMRISRGFPADRRALTCRLVSVESRSGVDMVYVEPADRSTIGLALPLKDVRSMTLVPPMGADAIVPLAPTAVA